MKNANKGRLGFTLIELLVVVLIIGVLAAVALPQYQKAVMKTRMAEYEVNLKALVDATQAYYLANGQYPTDDLTKLDIEVPECTKLPDGDSCHYSVGEIISIRRGSISGGAPVFIYSLTGNTYYAIPTLKNTLVCTQYFGDANCKKVGFTQKLDVYGPSVYIRP